MRKPAGVINKKKMEQQLDIDKACKEYSEVRAEMERLKLREVFLKEIIQPVIIESDDPIKKEYGTFKKHSYTSYEYSKQLKDDKVALKEREEDEKEMGVAVKKVTYSLKYVVKKK